MNRKMKKVLKRGLGIAVTIVFLGGYHYSDAWAQRVSSGRSLQGTKPCVEEMAKFCSHLQRDRSAIAACLKEHEEELSDSCKERISQMGKGRTR